MIYNDDEPILKQKNYTEEEADLELDGNTEARIFSMVEAPLVETPFKVLLELKGVGSDEGRLGVDLVIILNISGRMKEENNLSKMQLAVQFLMEKLSHSDRLSVVVTFKNNADRLCPLRQITENSLLEIANQVNALVSRSSRNTAVGIKMALKILNDRTRTKRRQAAIILMSDGIEDEESKSASFPVDKVPLYTFGFGSDCDPEVLNVIARNSYGGVFSAVSNFDNLRVAFSTSLAGHLNVAVKDLTLTIEPGNDSELSEVNVGGFQYSTGTGFSPVNISFGSLYDREIRKVLVTLTLPKVDKRCGSTCLKIVYKYRVRGKDKFRNDLRRLNVLRTNTVTEFEMEEVLSEEKRLRTLEAMIQASSFNFAQTETIYNDDESILIFENDSSAGEADLELDGNAEARIINKLEAPLAETSFKALLELKGIHSDEFRLGVDLVTILDISGSMKNENKLTKMQLAVRFLIQKLGRIDRLSVVTFNRKAYRLCPLRQITKYSRKEIANQVNSLVAGSSTNTAAGLKMALEILNHRTHTKRRCVAVILMSDGREDDENHFTNAPFGKVPVYTFGFGSDCDPKVLSIIANRSGGGMFSLVSDVDNLEVTFSMCLARLLNLVIADLTLIITPVSGSKFSELNAENFPLSKKTDVDPVTISFGSLYNQEIRKILVKLTLPMVDRQRSQNVLEIVYKYRVGRTGTYKSDRRVINVNRIDKSTEPEREQVIAEEKSLETVKTSKQERLLEDNKRLVKAREQLNAAKKSLSDEVYNILKSELDQLLALGPEASYDSVFFNEDFNIREAPTEEDDRIALDEIDMTIDFKNFVGNINNNPVGAIFKRNIRATTSYLTFCRRHELHMLLSNKIPYY